MGTCYYLVSPQRQRRLCVGKLRDFEDQRAYEAGTGEAVSHGPFLDVFWDSHVVVAEDAGVDGSNIELGELRRHAERLRAGYVFGALDAICRWMSMLEIRYVFITNDCEESWEESWFRLYAEGVPSRVSCDWIRASQNWITDHLEGRGDDVRVVTYPSTTPAVSQWTRTAP